MRVFPIDSRSALPGRLFVGFLFSMLLSGCVTFTDKPKNVPWHDCYEPITSPEAELFMQRGIALLEKQHGEAEVPIRRVFLRHSVKSPAASGYAIRENFSLTESVDPDRGLFCIYLSVPPNHPRFYYLLGHEIGHLLHPSVIDDPDQERFCNAFSQQLCEQENKPWNAAWENRRWVRSLESGKD